MDFRSSRTNILFRTGLLTLSIFFIVNSYYSDSFVITQVFFILLTGLQLVSLVKYLEKRNQEVLDFLNSIEFDDFSFNYSTDTGDENLARLNKEFNKVFAKLRELNREKEDDFQYMKNIVHHVGIGLITFGKDGEVQIINTAAKKLLSINQLEKIDDLKELSPLLVESFVRLKTGGRDLIRLEINGDIVQLAVYAIQLTLRGEEFKLVSIQNIQSELEEKEMEAWQNLVRVLTHEIMNSITPITSLATTVEDELKGISMDSEQITISHEDLEDINLAVKTIRRRSKGLIQFVQDFRNLTHIPKPKLEEIHLGDLFDEIITLMKKEISKSDIKLSVTIDENMKIYADKVLITQVLINLIKNATQAFEDQSEKNIYVKAYFGDKATPVISIRDNGTGIDEEALEKIFIPFFTTKKSGSGIGLSLSRQIMRQHKGVLGVKTKVDEGTEFLLRF